QKSCVSLFTLRFGFALQSYASVACTMHSAYRLRPIGVSHAPSHAHAVFARFAASSAFAAHRSTLAASNTSAGESGGNASPPVVVGHASLAASPKHAFTMSLVSWNKSKHAKRPAPAHAIANAAAAAPRRTRTQNLPPTPAVPGPTRSSARAPLGAD